VSASSSPPGALPGRPGLAAVAVCAHAGNGFSKCADIASQHDSADLECRTLEETQRPLFQAWLKSDASNNVGIVSNDWLGTASRVADGVALVIVKNNARLANDTATAPSGEILSLG
jgi:hypothetical protein